MAKTIEQLQALAQQIKQETIAKKNDATRVGGMLEDVVDKMEANEVDVTEKIATIGLKVDGLNQASVQTINNKKYLVFSSGKVVVPVEIPSISFDISDKSATLSASTGLNIYYTTDGTTPTTSSTKYTTAITLASGNTLKSITNNGSSSSSLPKLTSTITQDGDSATLAFSTSESGTIRYVKGTTDPTNASTIYSSALTLAEGEEYRAGVFSGSTLVGEIAKIQITA